MADPLLSTLCSICHINVPQYCCPRCSLQTCSLACSRRHKIWSSCNGIRDPTAYKPKSELATPSGIDHDYNFLHSIEHKIERSEKEIVLERMLVSKDELERARRGDGADNWRDMRQRKERQKPGDECIERLLRMMNTRVDRAPKGMKRNVENTTSWSRRRKTIHWQLEWIQIDGDARSLSKALGDDPIGAVYAAYRDEERRINRSPEDQRAGTKRKGHKQRMRIAKRRRIGQAYPSLTSTAVQILQNPETGAWNSLPAQLGKQHGLEASSEPEESQNYDFQLYLLRPYTPSNLPKVLVPLDLTKALSKVLQFRIVLEFPTIYVRDPATGDMPPQFMLEKDYCAKTGEIMPLDSDAEMELEHAQKQKQKHNDDEIGSGESSASDEDSDSQIEDGSQEDGSDTEQSEVEDGEVSDTSSSGEDEDEDEDEDMEEDG